jgi:transposase
VYYGVSKASENTYFHPSITIKALSPNTLNIILSHLDSGYSARPIAQETGVGRSTINKLCDKHRFNLPKPSGSRSQLLSSSDIQHANCLISSGRANNAVQVTRILQDITNYPLSVQTTRNHLKKAGLKARVKKQKLLLTGHHRRDQHDFAIAHRNWTVENWKHVVWSDGTKINRLGSDGRKWVWVRKGEGLSDRTVRRKEKFGGCLMMWGCMLWEGAGMACQIDGIIDGDLYIKILDDELEESLEYYDKTTEDIIFQQDNDCKHTSKKVKKWPGEHDYEVMLWPSKSADLNAIEHLWCLLKRKLKSYAEEPKGIEELWKRV